MSHPPSPPTVFISYSWDSPIHKDWVKTLADRLIGNGIKVIFDQYHCRPGDNFLMFMEQSVKRADRVLLILTEAYKTKADLRLRGAGFEGQVISAELYIDGGSNKFIPVLRSGDNEQSIPIFLQGRVGVDMREDAYFQDELTRLLKAIYEYSDEPTLGTRPDFVALAKATQSPPADSLPGEVGKTLAALRNAVIAAAALPELDGQSLQAVKDHPPRDLDEYRLARIAEWSQPRYALNRRFTRLTLLVDQGPEVQGVRWQAQSQSYDDLRKVLFEVNESAMVLLGPPGCGKSTLLRRLELDLAAESLRKPGEAWLSLFLPLSRYRALREGLPAPQAWLEQEWDMLNRDKHLPSFAELLHRGRFVLLLDAVNEMPHADAEAYRAAIAQWRGYLAELAVAAPGVRAVFSCRSLDYSASLSTPEFSVPHVRIERLDDAQVEEFLTLYNPEQGPALWRQLRGTPQLDLFRSPFYLKLLLAQADTGITSLHGRASLFTGFVRQALIREVQADNPLFRPGHLLAEWDFQRIVGRETLQGHELAGDSPLFPALSGFAHALQQKRGLAQDARIRVKRPEALAMLGGETGKDVLEAGVALQVLDMDGADVLFVHQLFQEYFAARAVVDKPEPGLAKAAWRATEMSPSLNETLQALADSDPLPAAPATGWEETFLLAVEMLDEPAAFITGLAKVNLPLAGRCATQINVPDALRQALQRELLARSRDPTADLRARIAAAHALGELGDPRFPKVKGPHGDYLQPPLVAVKGGVYTIGSDGGLYADEAPAHTVAITGFSIAQFPVTNAEWRCFQEAGGYDDEQWWDTDAAKGWRRGEGTAEGPKQRQHEIRQQLRDNPAQIQEWLNQGRITSQQVEYLEFLRTATDADFDAQLQRWYPPGRQTQPGFLNDSAYNAPAQPVVGVCWHEARAYCAWLSAQTGQAYRLPTEAEWEAAARGLPQRQWLIGRRKARVYPWGDRFEPSHCNTFESHVRGTTPVGVFPIGDSLIDAGQEGVADLSGNVWEWTGSVYWPYPYKLAEDRENPQIADERRVARGGSWGLNQGLARAAFRNYSPPDYRFLNLGFRLVCVAPILNR
ncbi:MAG: SUMF1/EgtB/PvdO family nonheme iron enzyme [Proteobacteria bacterium]|nr:SUMF1/EgtB/PvdO family nonheme iron enzyme [Pseudomonadota bacterium]